MTGGSGLTFGEAGLDVPRCSTWWFSAWHFGLTTVLEMGQSVELFGQKTQVLWKTPLGSELSLARKSPKGNPSAPAIEGEPS